MRVLLLLATSASLLLPAQAQAQQQQQPSADSANAIQVLIQEVRQLRLAIERSNTLVPRMQLTLSRFQSQQDRVERLERDLRSIRAQTLTESTTKEHMTSTLSRMEEQSRKSQDPLEQKQLEEAVRQMRRELELINQREQQARNQEADLSSQLKAEQGRLAELSNQLDQLDRKMQDPR